ncbi:MAG TPA: hypothetical protein VM871_11090, partial [Flavisolibacter sp.]|nr:hypothetical protein [Flavisolibacter sp.]
MMKNKRFISLCSLLLLSIAGIAQSTFPLNDVANPTYSHYAFTNATIVKDAGTTITNGTLVIKDGKIVAVGQGLKVPAGAIEISATGKYLYPSFIDIYSDYGTPAQQPRQGGFDFFARSQLTSNTTGAYGWNQAIRPEVDAYKVFAADATKAKALRDLGFGTVLTHVKDGIARGTGTVVSLADEKENLLILKDKASAHYSFNKGSSTQSYPNSMMGMIALLRQTYLDAQWYKSRPAKEGVNISLQAWSEIQNLPQIFDAGDKWNNLRADRIGDEAGVQYIIKAGGNEYQRMADIKATKASFIVTLNYPQAQDVEDPGDARFVSLTDLKHWELAPTNPASFEKAGINFCLTAADLRDPKTFLTAVRTAINYGLSEKAAMNALTKNPAELLGIGNLV